ncbi:SLC16A12 [Bugula neritina]|uniref:SLC16A12 n=1 Tax=Bugula neritina TaxID=10212 RepID=A0A7J7JU07_BUGNE|nr:SLC16A12 [Bugula neritina]
MRLPIDRGWAWVVVTACTALFAISAGAGKCQGVIMVEVIDKFQGVYKPSSLLWVFMSTFIFDGLFGPLAGYLMLKIGHRWSAFLGLFSLVVGNIGLAYAPNIIAMIICHSIPTGFGYMLTSFVAIMASSPYFVEKKALAVGLTTTGSGIGAFAIPPILRGLFDAFGFSGALLIYGGFSVQFMCLAALLRPISYYTKKSKKLPTPAGEVASGNVKDSTDQTAETDVDSPDTREIERAPSANIDTENKAKEKFTWRVILVPKMLMITMCSVVYMLGFSVTYTCIPAFARECGISDKLVSILMAVSGAIEIPCRIGNGWLADRKIITTTAQFAICVFLAGFFCLLCAIVSNLAGIILAIIGVSAVGSSVFSLEPLVFRELLGDSHVTSSLAMQAVPQCVSFAVSTLITGVIYDRTGSWRTVFYCISAIMMVSSTITWPYLFKNWYKRRQGTTPS